MDTKKRKILGAGAVILGAGAVAAATAGAGKKIINGIVNGTAGEPVRDPINKNALQPEFTVAEDGAVALGKGRRVAFNHCWGCCTMCGVRLHIDEAQDKVVRVAGNPYNPLSASHAVPMSMPVREALVGLSARSAGEEEPTGHERPRQTSCETSSRGQQNRSNTHPSRFARSFNPCGLTRLSHHQNAPRKHGNMGQSPQRAQGPELLRHPCKAFHSPGRQSTYECIARQPATVKKQTTQPKTSRVAWLPNECLFRWRGHTSGRVFFYSGWAMNHNMTRCCTHR